MSVRSAGHLQVDMQDRHYVVPVRRPALRDEVRQLDLRRRPGKGWLGGGNWAETPTGGQSAEKWNILVWRLGKRPLRLHFNYSRGGSCSGRRDLRT